MLNRGWRKINYRLRRLNMNSKPFKRYPDLKSVETQEGIINRLPETCFDRVRYKFELPAGKIVDVQTSTIETRHNSLLNVIKSYVPKGTTHYGLGDFEFTRLATGAVSEIHGCIAIIFFRIEKE